MSLGLNFKRLQNFLKSYPSELSGGMRQRAALIRTLALNPDVLLLDEPFSALDTITKGQMHSWYIDVIQKLQLSTILITHDIEETLLADNVVILKNGSVVLQDDSKNAFKDEKTILELNLDLPFNYKLYNYFEY